MTKLTISIDGEISVPSLKFDRDLLSDITWYPENSASHVAIADEIRGKHPYTVTILIEPLRYDLSRKKDNKIKYARRGGCGSSGSREINSEFIYALLTFNREQPVPSYWFLYSGDNHLLFIKRFSSLTVPDYDIGSNYSIDLNQDKELKQNGQLIRWHNWMNFSQLTTSCS